MTMRRIDADDLRALMGINRKRLRELRGRKDDPLLGVRTLSGYVYLWDEVKEWLERERERDRLRDGGVVVVLGPDGRAFSPGRSSYKARSDHE